MLQYKHRIGGFVNIHWYSGLCRPLPPSHTIVVSVQTLECQPQLLLVIFQIFGELIKVETPVFVLVTGRDNFLQRGEIKSCGSFSCSYTIRMSHSHSPHSHTSKEFHAKPAGQAETPSEDPHEPCGCSLPVQRPAEICPSP